MLPGFSTYNIENIRIGYIRKYFIDLSVTISFIRHFSNLPNLVIGKFRHIVFFSHNFSTVLFSIIGIFCMSIPSKIIKEVIAVIAIIMATFHSCWTWTNKGNEDNSINCISMILTENISQPNCKVAAFFTSGWRHKSLWIMVYKRNTSLADTKAFMLPIRPNSPVRTGLIPRKSRNNFPFLKRYAKLISSHGVNLLPRLALWLGPLGCFRTLRPVLL